MTATHESLLQAARAWVLLATSLPTGQVIPTDDEGTRPPLPYITVALSMFDLEQGHDEQVLSVEAGKLKEAIRGDRRATLTLNAYGKRGADLLALCHVSLRQRVVQDHLDKARITLTPVGQTQDISHLVDTAIEKRFVKDFYLDYAFISVAQAVPYLETFELEAEADDNVEFTNSFTVNLEA